MKALPLFLLCCATFADASSVEVRVVRKGKEVAIPIDSPLTSNMLALLASCSVHTAVYQSTNESQPPAVWNEALTSDSLIHLKFAKPATLKLEAASNQGREDYIVDEIIVGLPEGKWAGPLLVRTHKNVHAFGKYDPRALKVVAFEPVLGLSAIVPYKGLANLPPPPHKSD